MADQFALPPGATAATPDASQDTGGSTTTQQFALPPGATPAPTNSASATPDFSLKAAVAGPTTAIQVDTLRAMSTAKDLPSPQYDLY